tara:strand:- start:3306 stop:3698 length:393 start_codon:yes stop_codon:yes gene_type:complete
MSILTRSKSLPIISQKPPNKEENYQAVSRLARDIRVAVWDQNLETKRVNKQVCFLVRSKLGDEWWSIDEFLDGEEFTSEAVCEWINKKNIAANKFPKVKRRCLMCNRFAIHGLTICGICKINKCDRYIYG